MLNCSEVLNGLQALSATTRPPPTPKHTHIPPQPKPRTHKKPRPLGLSEVSIFNTCTLAMLSCVLLPEPCCPAPLTLVFLGPYFLYYTHGIWIVSTHYSTPLLLWSHLSSDCGIRNCATLLCHQGLNQICINR